jgi:5-methylthioadenosine/S-adenosylhomocysteine deaminase
MLSPLFSGIHMTQLNDADLQLIVSHGIGVVHCPQSNLKLGNGACPVGALVGAGVNVALGTDGAASNNDLDMIDELRTAALLAGPQIKAHQWLRIATLNGARALGLLDSIGSLVPGKWADICCLQLNDIYTQPIRDVATAVVYSATRGNVSDVWIAGRHLFANGAHARYDIQALIVRAQRWRERMDVLT